MIFLPAAVPLLVALFFKAALAQDAIPTFVIGDLSQYTLQGTPPADGDVVTYSDGPDGGVNVILSPGLQDKVMAATENTCQTFGNECVKSIRDALKQHGIIDSRSLQPRQFGEEVIATGILGAVAGWLASIIMGETLTLSGSGIIVPQPRPAGHLIPGHKIDLSFADAPEIAVVTEEGGPAVTITQDLSEPTTGPDAPSFEFRDGDLVITLPDDVAQKADYIATALVACATEEITGADGASQLRTRDDFLNAVLCGSRGLFTNAGPLGLLVMPMPYLNLIDPRMIETLNAYIAWGRAHAGNIQLPGDSVSRVIMTTFALGLIHANTGVLLPGANILPASWFNAQSPTGTVPSPEITAPPTSTSGSCPLETCNVSCSLRGVIQYCETECPDEESTSSSCTPTATEDNALYTTTAWEDWRWPDEYIQRPKATCSNDLSRLPWEVFKNLPAKFCAEVEANPSKEFGWLINYLGEPVPDTQVGVLKATMPTGLERRSWLSRLSESMMLLKRAPPVDPEVYKDYHVKFEVQPSTDPQASCGSSCAKAFARLQGSECNPTGSSEKTMKLLGSIDNNCAVYRFFVREPTAPPSPPPPPPPGPKPGQQALVLGERICHDTPANQKSDVHWEVQEERTKGFCEYAKDRGMVPEDEPLRTGSVPNAKGADIFLSISWAEGCQIEGPLRGQGLAEPVPGATCEQLLLENYRKCNNNGRGGKIQAGCLIYDYMGLIDQPF
ncbi:hypothetical protein QBC34DRAFT_493717 [Podospora aff. communis PSN243]|uniref:Uncharacterized protein n=1 Tax=Podospora aff. communis PSN243 TaxID=3040156 RepID=A0AAV9GS86_9PEZI|nr:hypothetical protein QBC34DRAFT_493717 [Podospora aff. communis PSN243]